MLPQVTYKEDIFGISLALLLLEPWCFIAYFNVIISNEEYKGTCTPAENPMTDFFNCSDSNHFIHLPTIGNPFTWSNGRKGTQLTEKRLDRAVCTMDFMDVCNTVVCNVLS